MLKDNLKTLRKNKGLTQEELSVKLNVVRQTISKWESGLSVPDAEMLISISEVFETPVSEILGENIEEKEKNDIKVISEKLEVINEQLSMKQKQTRKRTINFLIIMDVCIILLFILSMLMLTAWEYLVGVILEKFFKTKYWDYSNHKVNFQGRICLTNSIYWGILGVVFLKYIHPFILNLLSRIQQ